MPSRRKASQSPPAPPQQASPEAARRDPLALRPGESEPLPPPPEPPEPPPRKGRRRHLPHSVRYPPLTVEEILAWADEHFAHTRQWPSQHSGQILAAPRETWRRIDQGLRCGYRALPGGSSLPRLLAERRGRPHPFERPPLTEQQILAWADSHRSATGRWPTQYSGPVAGAPGEVWQRVDAALREGRRGFPGGSSLPRLLAARRGRRYVFDLPVLTIPAILSWADAHRARTGRWPTKGTGAIAEAPGESWNAVGLALERGIRGLQGGITLAKLLALHRKAPYRPDRPCLSEERILAWADDHCARTGTWPGSLSGAVVAAPEESWSRVNTALFEGQRGLPGASSVAQLLSAHRGVRNPKRLERLTEERIIAAAEAHHRRTGGWPTRTSGVIAEIAGDSWLTIDAALRKGTRGLPEPSSLATLLKKHGRKMRRQYRPELTVEQVLAWARAYFERRRRWPHDRSGPVEDAPGETWGSIHVCLFYGYRGLPAGMTIARLLKAHGMK